MLSPHEAPSLSPPPATPASCSSTPSAHLLRSDSTRASTPCADGPTQPPWPDKGRRSSSSGERPRHLAPCEPGSSRSTRPASSRSDGNCISRPPCVWQRSPARTRRSGTPSRPSRPRRSYSSHRHCRSSDRLLKRSAAESCSSSVTPSARRLPRRSRANSCAPRPAGGRASRAAAAGTPRPCAYDLTRRASSDSRASSTFAPTPRGTSYAARLRRHSNHRRSQPRGAG
ncbi:hypothetical protein ACFPRL_01545 [Pseudoclavibacter helvolus]